MALELQVSLGDIIVAACTAGSIFVAYQAVKGQMTGVLADLGYVKTKVKEHTRLHHRHSTKIAGLEGRVFGRRIDDPRDEAEWRPE